MRIYLSIHHYQADLEGFNLGEHGFALFRARPQPLAEPPGRKYFLLVGFQRHFQRGEHLQKGELGPAVAAKGVTVTVRASG